MKRVDYSSRVWEERVLALLGRHPDTIAVVDARHLPPDARRGADGIWRVMQEGRKHEIPFSVHVASPWTREVNFEVALLRGRERVPGAALSELVQLAFVCSPESHSLLTLPGHVLRERLAAIPGDRRRATPIGYGPQGAVLAERVALPIAELRELPGATVSSPESW